MKPLYHPSIDDITVQGVLYALSDPVRVEIFMQLAGGECSKNCTAFLNVNTKPLPKSTLSQHFKVLREAGLIRSERQGVELQNRTRCSEFGSVFGPLIGEIVNAYKASSKKREKK